MEALFYLADLLATVLLMHWAAKNANRPPGSQAAGLFAYREMQGPTAKARAVATMTPPTGAGTRGGWRDPGRRDPGSRDLEPRRPGRRDAGR